MKKFLIITVGLTTLFLIGCQTITNSDPAIEIPINDIQDTTGDIQDATGFIIQSFEDCLNSGFPIMESYPRQCNDGTTTYVEEILQENTAEYTTGEIYTGEITEEVDTITQQDTGTNLSALQQKLKAMLERRNQETQTNSGIVQSTPQNTTPTSTTTNSNEQVTEDDIENLEKIIEQILQQ